MSKQYAHRITMRLFVVYSRFKRASESTWAAGCCPLQARAAIWAATDGLSARLSDQQLYRLQDAIRELFNQPEFPADQARELINATLQMEQQK